MYKPEAKKAKSKAGWRNITEDRLPQKPKGMNEFDWFKQDTVDPEVKNYSGEGKPKAAPVKFIYDSATDGKKFTGLNRQAESKRPMLKLFGKKKQAKTRKVDEIYDKKGNHYE